MEPKYIKQDLLNAVVPEKTVVKPKKLYFRIKREPTCVFTEHMYHTYTYISQWSRKMKILGGGHISPKTCSSSTVKLEPLL